MKAPSVCLSPRTLPISQSVNILLLSAYDAASHQAWRIGLVNYFSNFDWTVLALQPRFFSWRIRGNSLCWAFGQREVLTRRYDLVIATSVVDISALKGMVPELCTIPTIVYFHENQFAYPATDRQVASIEPQMVNLYSALAADAVVFNSDYNRQTFLTGVNHLLKKFPDQVPAGLPELLANKSRVLPVPLGNEVMNQPASHRKTSGPYTIVWNHRWEYDKGPDRLLACLRALPPELDLRFHIIGQNFRQAPGEFTQIKQLLGERNWLGQWGFVEDRHAYYDLLGQCDAVLSTAIHDFQGLAILEGAALGCRPIVPDRLAYREIFADGHRYESTENTTREAQACAEHITALVNSGINKGCAANISDNFSWHRLGPDYLSLFDELTRNKKAS